MHVLSLSKLRAFWATHPRAERALSHWHKIASKADWDTRASVLAAFPTADVVGDDRIIFDIRGGEFRLGVHFKYRSRIAMVCFVGTYRQYDAIDPETV